MRVGIQGKYNLAVTGASWNNLEHKFWQNLTPRQILRTVENYMALVMGHKLLAPNIATTMI